MSHISRQNLTSLSRSKTHLKPQLKKRALTQTNTPDTLSFNKLRANTQTQQQHEYSELALMSLDHNFPLSQLKPYSSFNSVQKISQKITNQELEFKPFHNKKRHTMYDKFLFPQKSNTDTINTTFYQSKTKFKKNKFKFNTMTHFHYTKPIDEEQRMVIEFVKEEKDIIKKQKTTFENFNQKIMDLFPQHFEPNYMHLEQKCKSTSCNEGFFQRRKYKVQDKYEIQQPGFGHRFIKTKVPKKPKTIKQDISFCLFAKRKNRILSTDQPLKRKQQKKSKQQVPKQSIMDMNVTLRQKFRAQSAEMYKKYMRSSFKGKKVAMIEDMQIKFD